MLIHNKFTKYDFSINSRSEQIVEVQIRHENHISYIQCYYEYNSKEKVQSEIGDNIIGLWT